MRLGVFEELLDVGDVLGEAVGGQGFKENTAVALALDAGVEEHQNTTIRERADKAAEALLKCDDGVGNLVVEEGFAPESFDGFHSGFDDRVAGDGEGETVDDDATQLLALYVDSLPEGGGAEEDGVGGGGERREKSVTRRR